MKPFKYGVMDDVSLREERGGKRAVLTFGRFNPPTSGHELLINKVIQEAKKRRADNFIFASHSQDKRKNPLDSKTKTNYMKTFFKKAKIMYNPAVRTIFEALALLADKGYKNITVVVGGDRTEEFERTVRPYVNHPDPNKSLNLDNFEVVSAGRRDPDATDVSGMSASKMRAAATEGDFDSFKKGVPSSATDAQAKKLFNDLRKAMGIREEINEETREFVKGWVNPRTKKIIAWRHHTPYHATHIYENLSKYGLTVDDLIDHHIAVLSKRNPKYKPEREELEKRFEKIGYNDMLADRDETIEYPAIKKGWVAFVLQETKYGKMMTLRGITKDIKKSGIMVLEKYKTFKDLDRILITNYKNAKFADYTGKTKNEDERYTSNSEAMQFLFGRRPKRREPKTEIGRTMAMFREFCEAVKTRIDTDQEVLVVQDKNGKPNIFKDLETAKKKAESISGKVIKGTKGEIMVQVLIDPSLRKHLEEAKRVPKTRKNQDPDTHSDLYTDEDPKGTIHGLGFKDVETAEASVRKIKSSDRTHAHKIQAAIAMEQRAKVMKKTAEAAVYRKFIEEMKKKTKEMNEDSWKDKNDEREHNKLFMKSMRVMPRSPQQKKIIQQMNALRKKNGLELLKEERKATKPIKVLVFSGYSEENDNNMMKTAKRLNDECKKRGIKCFVAFVPFSRSFKNDDGTRTVVNKDGKEFIANRFDTVVVVRGAAGQKSGTLDMISMFEKDGFFVINSRDSIEICSDKYRTAVTLTEAGLPTPRTALVTDIKMIDDVHKQVGGKFPVVAKTLRGSKGKGVFILDSKESFKSVLDAVQKIDEDEEIILQEYIDMKNDMRIIVLDGKIMGVMQRDKVKGDFRSNFSLGGSVKEIKISDEIKDLALQSAKAVGCYYCGVDVAISKRTKKPYILEINSSPGSEGFEIATKDNLVGDFVDYISDKENWMYSPTVVGRREMVTVEGIGPIVGKFDTGNMVVNSIHADKFDIDGDVVKWTHNGKRFTNKVIDTITVLQGAIAHNEEKRPMIELDIEFMGKKYPKRKFTIDDRSQKGTPLLMGVPFMKEFGLIVDPGKTFIKTQSLEEATLTKKEMKLRDKYAKDLKKRSSSFKSRYGKDYKDVIFGTATNMAKNKSEEEYTQNREGTKELTKKYKKMTPGQMNEIASFYFSRK